MKSVIQRRSRIIHSRQVLPLKCLTRKFLNEHHYLNYRNVYTVIRQTLLDVCATLHVLQIHEIPSLKYLPWIVLNMPRRQKLSSKNCIDNTDNCLRFIHDVEHSLALPAYLVTSTHYTFWSATTNHFAGPSVKLSTIGCLAVLVAAAKTLDALPDSVASTHSSVKWKFFCCHLSAL